MTSKFTLDPTTCNSRLVLLRVALLPDLRVDPAVTLCKAPKPSHPVAAVIIDSPVDDDYYAAEFSLHDADIEVAGLTTLRKYAFITRLTASTVADGPIFRRLRAIGILFDQITFQTWKRNIAECQFERAILIEHVALERVRRLTVQSLHPQSFPSLNRPTPPRTYRTSRNPLFPLDQNTPLTSAPPSSPDVLRESQ